MIKESEKRNSASTNFHLNSFKIDGNLYLKNGLGATVGYFNSSGTKDTDVVESSTNKPDSDGFIYQIEYLPWYNTKFSIQYVTFSKFNGASTNYNGAGRSAADNNTLYLLAWFNF